ncbi:MAG: hypothetical protein R3B48_23405 [Kofleriaceae bacterium]
MLRLLVLCALTACGASYNGKSPASDGVRALVDALRGEDPQRAYDMLSADVRAKVSYREFQEQWHDSRAERASQITALEATLRGAPDVGERAYVRYADGTAIPLERDGRVWTLEAPLAARPQAPRPRDAIRAFADAVERRDVDAALDLLTAQRREGLARQIAGFLHGFSKHVFDEVEEHGDAAELRWDEDGIRYRIMLRREAGEWRVDDISIRVAPQDPSDDAVSNEKIR